MDSYLELFIHTKYDSCVRRKKKKNFARQPSELKAISRLAAIAVSRLNYLTSLFLIAVLPEPYQFVVFSSFRYNINNSKYIPISHLIQLIA